MSFPFSSFSSFLSSSRVLLILCFFSWVFVSPIPFHFHLGPKISGRDLLLVEECCNAPDSMRQVSASYSLSLSCHLLACCIFILSSCAFHFAYVFVSCIRAFSPLSVLQSDTPMSSDVPLFVSYCERVLNILGMDSGLPSGLGTPPVDRLSSFVPFGVRLILQRLTG